MKLNKIFLTGIFASGLSFNSYSQDTSLNHHPQMLEIKDKNNDSISDEYTLMIDFQDSVEMFIFSDKNFDGKIDNTFVNTYRMKQEYDRASFGLKKGILSPWEEWLEKVKSKPLGEYYSNCEENHFKKKLENFWSK
ncbi:MAG: hypothetical protein Q8O84_00995 [Nanoarchaeota archaeon]|nr:hypothetical protein [Nanoarchaeota archaeon]